jgi:hypothetical protein
LRADTDRGPTPIGTLVPAERIERAILSVRGFRVMLDSDLAEIYGVKTKVLNQAVKRNPDCFPEDFLFRLTSEETGRGGRRYSPFVFTEHGALMFDAVRRLMAPPAKARPRIGFRR